MTSDNVNKDIPSKRDTKFRPKTLQNAESPQSHKRNSIPFPLIFGFFVVVNPHISLSRTVPTSKNRKTMEKIKGKNSSGHCDGNIEVYVDDDDEELEAEGTTEEEVQNARRDEVREVRKMSSKDTNRLRVWRIVMTSVILLTACAITFTTYTLLVQQEDENFKTAVRFVHS